LKLSNFNQSEFLYGFICKIIQLAKDNKKKDESLKTKEKTETKLDGKTLHDLYRHTTKLIK